MWRRQRLRIVRSRAHHCTHFGSRLVALLQVEGKSPLRLRRGIRDRFDLLVQTLAFAELAPTLARPARGARRSMRLRASLVFRLRAQVTASDRFRAAADSVFLIVSWPRCMLAFAAKTRLRTIGVGPALLPRGGSHSCGCFAHNT